MNLLNQIILEGNCTEDAEVRNLPDGTKSVSVPIAVNHFFKNRAGESVTEVSFFDVEAYGSLAEYMESSCKKGCDIRLVGKLKQERWKDSEGRNQSKIIVIAEHIDTIDMK